MDNPSPTSPEVPLTDVQVQMAREPGMNPKKAQR